MLFRSKPPAPPIFVFSLIDVMGTWLSFSKSERTVGVISVEQLSITYRWSGNLVRLEIASSARLRSSDRLYVTTTAATEK